MKTALFPPVTKDMPSKERIMELVRGGIYTLCFIGILIHLSECYRLFYQVSKDEQISIALIFFCTYAHGYTKSKAFEYSVINSYSLLWYIGFLRNENVSVCAGSLSWKSIKWNS